MPSSSALRPFLPSVVSLVKSSRLRQKSSTSLGASGSCGSQSFDFKGSCRQLVTAPYTVKASAIALVGTSPFFWHLA
eukprot:CAMPEP_0115872822 /NCGR_PEP_ID=MMETSP0287-20121206/23642_1 /TAXON_ID=412157 /ORGANISM="Chrysochromulina rotalis, Strain UIO044" /LENGTH=76 /DNA_ID=CAMNT_0003327791 /DNA_START=183 /DNA_END=409 /DNA_ORIENTATION=-